VEVEAGHLRPLPGEQTGPEGPVLAFAVLVEAVRAVTPGVLGEGLEGRGLRHVLGEPDGVEELGAAVLVVLVEDAGVGLAKEVGGAFAVVDEEVSVAGDVVRDEVPLKGLLFPEDFVPLAIDFPTWFLYYRCLIHSTPGGLL